MVLRIPKKINIFEIGSLEEYDRVGAGGGAQGLYCIASLHVHIDIVTEFEKYLHNNRSLANNSLKIFFLNILNVKKDGKGFSICLL